MAEFSNPKPPFFMKKQTFLTIFLLFSLHLLSAQKNSVAILAGPSAIYYWTDDFEQKVIQTSVGYALGLDLARKINSKWQFKLGARYAFWEVPNLAGGFQWPSEHDGNGGFIYDPNLQHYITQGFTQRIAFQVLSGMRWQSAPTDFHWVAVGELGLSAFAQNDAGIKTNLHPTLGLAYGAEFALDKHWFLFATPGIRFIFRDFDRKNTPERHLINAQAELGARFAF